MEYYRFAKPSDESHKLAWIQDAFRVQRAFDLEMESADFRRRGVGPPAHFREASPSGYAVFQGTSKLAWVTVKFRSEEARAEQIIFQS